MHTSKLKIPSYLLKNPFIDVKWDVSDKPILLLDDKLIPINNLNKRVKGEVAYIVGINQKTIGKIFEYLDAKIIQFYEMKVDNIVDISKFTNIEELSIQWNDKLVDIAPIQYLTNLKILVLIDTPKINDLTPLSKLKKIKKLSFSGGMNIKNVANSLLPLSELASLEFIQLHNLKVNVGGIKPLSKLTNLKEIDVSNQFPTEEYAYLSTVLISTYCKCFAPYVDMGHYSIAGKNIMVTGARKPFLNRNNDRLKLDKYVRNFEILRERYLKG